MRHPRASALLDGAAGVHLTAAVVLNAAVTEAEAAGGVLPLALGRAAAAVAAVPEGEAFGMVGVGGGGGGGGGRMAADLAKERDEHVRAYVAAHKVRYNLCAFPFSCQAVYHLCVA